MLRSTTLIVSLLGVASIATADPVKCQKQVVKSLATYKKVFLKGHEKCLDKVNGGDLPGPCPDPVTSVKILGKLQAASDKITAACTMADLTTLGYPSDCALETSEAGVEAGCAALPVTTSTEFAACLACWKTAEVAEFIATLYASHAVELCNGDLSGTSPVCSDLDNTAPLPDQRNLGGGSEGDCQAGIGKAGVGYIMTRLKTLEKCGLAGLTRAACLGDLAVQTKLAKAELKRQVLVQKKCGNRDPVPSPPFCCKTGPGNACMLASDRDDCTTNLGGQVQEGKVCGGGLTCDPTPGSGSVTWWGVCPETGAALTTQADMVACIGAVADEIVDELLCWQFPANGGADWPCPAEDDSPSAAFLDGIAG